ncbi:MAG: signal peptidase II [Candidatus Eisenbacteria bacterium]|nr:signal peptidase II [Candidatus Eisenbacteria bacterium]
MAHSSGTRSDVRASTARLLWTGLAVLVADQAVKRLVVALMALGDSVEVLGPAVRITRTENTGAAFGLFRGGGAVFVVVSALASVCIIALSRRIARLRRVEQLAFALVLGGALGNLVDRVRHGAVVDFIDIGIRDLRWPAFNVADSAIVIGVALLAARFLLFPHRSEPAELPARDGDAS